MAAASMRLPTSHGRKRRMETHGAGEWSIVRRHGRRAPNFSIVSTRIFACIASRPLQPDPDAGPSNERCEIEREIIMDGTGQYRTRGVDELSHTAFVTDKSISFSIGEKLYRWRGYAPPFDDLAWREEPQPAPQ